MLAFRTNFFFKGGAGLLSGTTRQVVIVAVADLDFNVGERSAGFAIF